jgi:hypothetical protein
MLSFIFQASSVHHSILTVGRYITEERFNAGDRDKTSSMTIGMAYGLNSCRGGRDRPQCVLLH